MTSKPESGLSYDTAYNRVSDALRSEEDSHILGKVGALLIGVGVGVGVVLIAPARGNKLEPTQPRRFRVFGDEVRELTGKKPQSATGTYGG